MKPIYINGRFLTQKLTGVQRYGQEILRALDQRLGEETCDAKRSSWILVVPEGSRVPIDLQYIRIVSVGRSKGHVWEQTVFAHASRDGIALSLCNSGPLFHPCALSVIHDAVIYRHPEYFSRFYRLFHGFVGKWLAHHSNLATVSAFSQRELSAVMQIPAERITVIPNGSDHIAKVVPDKTVLEQFSLVKGQYFLFVGSPARHKNLATAISAYEKAKPAGIKFVIVGAVASAVFGGDIAIHGDDVIVTGRLTDEQIAALYEHAAAFIFPSLYEGFGIPPLEAMVHNCPVLASDIPACREVCGNAALYFDPNDVNALAQAMRDFLNNPALGQDLIAKGVVRVKAYSWAQSAQRLLDRVSAL